MNIKAKAKAQFIIAGIALVFSIFALFTINKNNGLAWFSSNDKVTANGLAVQVKCDDIFVSIEYYRVSDQIIYDEDGTKHNRYIFSFADSALDVTETYIDANGNSVTRPERDSFSTPVRMYPYSDLGGNCQILIEVTAKTADPFIMTAFTETNEYLGNTIAAAIAAQDYDAILPTGLPLTSVVKYAFLSDVSIDSENQTFIVDDHDVYDHETDFVTFDESGNGNFDNPGASGFEITPNNECKFYIFIDYNVEAVEDINAKIMEYVEKALHSNEDYNDIILGATNLLFSADFDFELLEE